MEARISALEAAHIETRDRLARIETRLDAVATKADLLDMKTALHQQINAQTTALHQQINVQTTALYQQINAQTWKLVTFVCSFGTALVTATYFVAKHAH